VAFAVFFYHLVGKPKLGWRKKAGMLSPLIFPVQVFFDIRFFYESVSSWPKSILLRPFQNFMKICGDTRNFVFIAGANDTGDKTPAINIGN
jgi:hypothetical protein